MEPFIGVVGEYVGKAVVAALGRLLSGTAYDPLSVAGRLRHHITEIESWSQHIQQFGASEPLETDAVTVRLRMYAGLRRDSQVNAVTRTEEDLLIDPAHFLILGQPGAGKTTTLKRLARRLLFDEPVDAADIFQYPIAIRLREFPRAMTLNMILASVLGISGERKHPVGDANASAVADGAAPILYIGDLTLQQFVVDFLNATGGVVLLDGIDEVEVTRRSTLYDEIVQLAYLLKTSKIIATSRTGDYQRTFQGFKLLEICPLNDDEVDQIARRLLGEPSEFLRRVKALPYSDVTDRPLLLSQLAFLYRRYGYLPEQPALVYRKIVTLLLQEWDAERGVVRRSVYAGFDADRKAEFLAALAFHLTFVTKAKRFTDRDLRQAYTVIHPSFGVPASEAEQVVAELETHTGLIAATGLQHFEFAHLSLQEYLCANYLVRDPFTPSIDEYLREYPDPIAIAVTLASNPANWFAAVILRHVRRGAMSPAALQGFLGRLLIERPYFEISEFLGVAVMKLLRDYGSSHLAQLDEFLVGLQAVPNVRESMRLGLTLYSVSDRWSATPEIVELYSSSSMVDGWDIPLPDAISVPADVYREFMTKDKEKLLEHLYARRRQIYEPKPDEEAPKGRPRRH